MIEVAGADRKFGRHRALVEPQLAPKPPKPCAQIEFALRRHGRTLSKIHKSRKSRRDTATFFLRPTPPLRCFIGITLSSPLDWPCPITPPFFPLRRAPATASPPT